MKPDRIHAMALTTLTLAEARMQPAGSRAAP
jgi:hypothetical protein